ncbi:MAG: hypothetical protein ACRELY_22065, partial [Polyangiaceae bacterium]
MSTLYKDLASRCKKLDLRTSNYRFDLEQDIAWDRVREGGRYCPDALFVDLGVDVARLRDTSGAIEIFDWGMAVSISRLFCSFEESVIEFASAAREWQGRTRSLELLVEEERKHIELFERYEKHLLTERPELATAVIDAVVPSVACFDARFGRAARDTASGHYLSWLNIIFLEELTIYIAERLRADPSIQPAWASAHAAHYREELQHVVTDVAYMESLELDDATRHELSRSFVLGVFADFAHLTGLACPLHLLIGIHPALSSVVPRGRISERGVVRDILRSPTFRRSRQFAPYLV